MAEVAEVAESNSRPEVVEVEDPAKEVSLGRQEVPLSQEMVRFTNEIEIGTPSIAIVGSTYFFSKIHHCISSSNFLGWWNIVFCCLYFSSFNGMHVFRKNTANMTLQKTTSK